MDMKISWQNKRRRSYYSKFRTHEINFRTIFLLLARFWSLFTCHYFWLVFGWCFWATIHTHSMRCWCCLFVMGLVFFFWARTHGLILAHLKKLQSNAIPNKTKKYKCVNRACERRLNKFENFLQEMHVPIHTYIHIDGSNRTRDRERTLRMWKRNVLTQPENDYCSWKISTHN